MKLEPLLLDLIFEEKLIITFVLCSPGSALKVLKQVTKETIIFSSIIGRRNMLVLLTDTTCDMVKEDMKYIEDLVYSVAGVIKLRHRVENINDTVPVFPKIKLTNDRY